MDRGAKEESDRRDYDRELDGSNSPRRRKSTRMMMDPADRG